jgi:hypothetical protein
MTRFVCSIDELEFNLQAWQYEEFISLIKSYTYIICEISLPVSLIGIFINAAAVVVVVVVVVVFNAQTLGEIPFAF